MISLIYSNFQIYGENEATDWWCLWLIAFQNARVIWKSVWLYYSLSLFSTHDQLNWGSPFPFHVCLLDLEGIQKDLFWNDACHEEQLQLFLRSTGAPVPLNLFLLICHVQCSPSGLSAVKIWRVLFLLSHTLILHTNPIPMHFKFV